MDKNQFKTMLTRINELEAENKELRDQLNSFVDEIELESDNEKFMTECSVNCSCCQDCSQDKPCAGTQQGAGCDKMCACDDMGDLTVWSDAGYEGEYQ